LPFSFITLFLSHIYFHLATYYFHYYYIITIDITGTAYATLYLDIIYLIYTRHLFIDIILYYYLLHITLYWCHYHWDDDFRRHSCPHYFHYISHYAMPLFHYASLLPEIEMILIAVITYFMLIYWLHFYYYFTPRYFSFSLFFCWHCHIFFDISHFISDWSFHIDIASIIRLAAAFIVIISPGLFIWDIYLSCHYIYIGLLHFSTLSLILFSHSICVCWYCIDIDIDWHYITIFIFDIDFWYYWCHIFSSISHLLMTLNIITSL
jgi:hypothetical protein